MAALGAGKKPPVRVTINGHSYRSTVATVDGQPMVGLSRTTRSRRRQRWRRSNRGIELDTAAREVEVPPELVDAWLAIRCQGLLRVAVQLEQELAHTPDRWRQDRRNAPAQADKSMHMLREGKKP
jgi:hypothetical protein